LLLYVLLYVCFTVCYIWPNIHTNRVQVIQSLGRIELSEGINMACPLQMWMHTVETTQQPCLSRPRFCFQLVTNPPSPTTVPPNDMAWKYCRTGHQMLSSDVTRSLPFLWICLCINKPHVRWPWNPCLSFLPVLLFVYVFLCPTTLALHGWHRQLRILHSFTSSTACHRPLSTIRGEHRILHIGNTWEIYFAVSKFENAEAASRKNEAHIRAKPSSDVLLYDRHRICSHK